jgi:hypothetical protein
MDAPPPTPHRQRQSRRECTLRRQCPPACRSRVRPCWAGGKLAEGRRQSTMRPSPGRHRPCLPSGVGVSVATPPCPAQAALHPWPALGLPPSIDVCHTVDRAYGRLVQPVLSLGEPRRPGLAPLSELSFMPAVVGGVANAGRHRCRVGKPSLFASTRGRFGRFRWLAGPVDEPQRCRFVVARRR